MGQSSRTNPTCAKPTGFGDDDSEHRPRTPTVGLEGFGLPIDFFELSVAIGMRAAFGRLATRVREWQPSGAPVPVRVHDFIDPVLGKAIPYGVYDVTRNEGWVNVGVDHDAAEFAVASIRRWWNRKGRYAYPHSPCSGLADERRHALGGERRRKPRADE
jgi:hypothetical protein